MSASRDNQLQEKRLQEKLKKLRAWLVENQVVVPEPKQVTLSSFSVNWSEWSGHFSVSFDGVETERRYGFGLQQTGWTELYLPMFTSPLGVPASYAAVVMSAKTKKAIEKGLQLTFPRLLPLGRNRDTGKEIAVNTPLNERLPEQELNETKAKVTGHFSNYSVSVNLGEM